MKILITGANGLLGHKLVDLLSQQPEVQLLATSLGKKRLPHENVAYQSMDISNEREVQTIFNEFQPDAVVHAASITQVDFCEGEKDLCNLVNVEGTRHIAKASRNLNSHLVYVSTDFVFDGEKGPYKETDPVNPLSVYGRSKADAEEVVMQSGLHNWAIARTIIIYGYAPTVTKSHVIFWVRDSLKEGKSITVVNDQFRAPTLAEDLAMGCWEIVKRKAQGIYHLSGPETQSIFEIAGKVADHYSLDKTLILPVASATLNQAAKRPPRTGFIIEKAHKELNYTPRTLQMGLDLMDSQAQS